MKMVIMDYILHKLSARYLRLIMSILILVSIATGVIFGKQKGIETYVQLTTYLSEVMTKYPIERIQKANEKRMEALKLRNTLE